MIPNGYSVIDMGMVLIVRDPDGIRHSFLRFGSAVLYAGSVPVMSMWARPPVDVKIVVREYLSKQRVPAKPV